MMKYPNLFSPLKVNGMMLRNRILAAPMGIIASHKLISSTNYGAMSVGQVNGRQCISPYPS